jgi:hypothetical protein
VSLRVSSTTTGLLCVSPGGRPRAAAKVFAGYLCRDERAHPADFAATHDGASFAAHYGTRRANALARCVAQKATTAGGLLTAMGAASSSSCFDHRPPGATTLKTRTKTFAVYFVRGHC